MKILHLKLFVYRFPLRPNYWRRFLAAFSGLWGIFVLLPALRPLMRGLHQNLGWIPSEIFLGKIKKWNDPAIASLNPNVPLPDLPITVIHRSDGSGTTAAFTAHLSATSPEWKNEVGTGLNVSWKTGTGIKDNAGISAQVQQGEGVIGCGICLCQLSILLGIFQSNFTRQFRKDEFPLEIANLFAHVCK